MKNIACNNIWIIPLALFLLFASERSAAQGEYKFRTLSPLGGYAYDGVNDTAIDGVGFVWALLETDLIRFDGYEYKRYYSHFKGKGVDSRLMFHDLVSDSAGRLYVSCVQGLFRYDRQNDSFEKLLDRPHLIFSDARDNLWVRQEEHLGILRGVDSLDIKTFEGRPVSDVFTTETCADGSFLVASYYGNILRYDYDTGTFTRFHTFPAGHFILKIARLDDKLWVLLRDQGLVVMDIATGRVETAHDFPTKFERRAVISRDMLIDRQGLIWIATQQGVWVFNPGTLERHLYRHSEVDTFSIPHNSVRSVEEDSEGNIWIGTFSGGLCMVDPRENKSFTTWGPGRGGLSNNMVSAFAEDDNAL